MNDRFRFRAWNKEEKQLYYDAEDTYDCLAGKPYPIGASYFGCLLYNENWIVEQCTGLKDKNDNLIYEGDIIGGIYGGYIAWCDKEKSFEMFAPEYGCMSCSGDILWQEIVEDDGILEIIGNIHENKELLDE